MVFRKADVDPCERCGALDWTDPTLVEKTRSWLRVGGPWRAAGPFTCRRCGNVILGFGYGPRLLSARFRRGLPGPARVVLAPVWLVRALRQSRTRIPSPWIYLAAGLMGIAGGVVLQVTLDVPWWLVAISVVVFVWLLFLASAFQNLRNVASSFLHSTAPGVAIRMSERRADDELRATDLLLYGLPASWRGPRFVGGRSTDGRQVTSWTLAHGYPYDDRSPDFRIEVSRLPEYPPGLKARHIFEEFQHTSRRPPQDLSPDEFHVWVVRTHREIRDLPDPDWAAVPIPIDGAPVPFAYLASGEHWVAWAAVGEVIVVVHATRMPVGEVALVRVDDVEPYIEGSRILHEAPPPAHES